MMKTAKSLRKTTHEPAIASKFKRVLFRPLSEKVTPLSPQTKEPNASRLSIDSDKQQTELDIALQYFPNLEKLDYRNITQYEETKLDSKCDLALDQFKIFLDKCVIEDLSKTIKDDMSKVLVICSNYVTKYLVACMSGEIVAPTEQMKKALDQLILLNKFLLFSMGDRKNPILLGQFDMSIIQIANEAFDQIHKQLITPNKFKDNLFAANVLCCLFQSLAITIALNEGRSFMKSAASELIRVGFEIFVCSLKDSLSNPLLKEIYKTRLGNNETWKVINQEHIKVAVDFDKAKFYVIQLSPQVSTPQFSLRYMNLYYILKILQLLSSDENSFNKENLLKLIADVIKDGTEFIETKANSKETLNTETIADIELAFNESLVCFKIIKRTAPKIGDSSILFDKLAYMHFLRPVIENYLRFALKFNLVVTFSNSNKGDISKDSLDVISYKTTHDYISGVFNFLSKIKNTKDPINLAKASRSGIKSSASTILTLIEEIVSKLIGNIDAIEGTNDEIQVLKAYIAEYLFENRHTMSRQTAEHIIKLITSTRFHYTSPKSLKAFDLNTYKESLLEKLTNKRIVILLQDIIEYDKAWAETILQHLIKLIPELLGNEEALFGLSKLIYCGMTGEFHDNNSFYKKMFKDEYKSLNYNTYIKLESRDESKALKGFIDVKGISELIEILMTKLYKDGIRLVESDKVMRITENLFLGIVELPLISQQLLSELSLVIKFLEYVNIGPDPNCVTVRFLEELLATIKYKVKAGEKINEKTNYLPLHIINFIRKNIERNDVENVIRMMPFVELIVRFINQESEAPSIRPHQITISNIINLEDVHTRLDNNCDKPYIGRCIKLAFMLLGRLQKNNETVAMKVKNSSFISKNKLYILTKKVISKGLLNIQEIKDILCLLLEIIFETSIEFIDNNKLLIKQFQFLKIYLSILAYLSKFSEWTEVIITHCKSLINNVSGSYFNYSICSQSEIFNELLKLTKRFIRNDKLLSILMEHCKNSICINGSSRCLQDFIGLLNVSTNNEVQYEHLFTFILSLFVPILSSRSPREVFTFLGNPYSGIGLMARKALPKDGFCFCGSIWIERNDQSKPFSNNKMTIFKLGASKTKEIELFLKEGYLNYQMGEAKQTDNKCTVSFMEKKLEEDRWYFIELYHTNNETQKNLCLYIDSVLIKETSIKQYTSQLLYDENTIGCGVKLDYVSKKGKESIIDNFRGEMTTMYFIEVNIKSIGQLHNTLASVEKSVGLENIINYINTTHESKLDKNFDINIIEKIFMHINPKYTERITQHKHKADTITRKGKSFDIYNSVERVYSETIIDHNMLAKDSFLNIGGVKTLLPALHKIAKSNPSTEFGNFVIEKLLELLELTMHMDSQRVTLFLYTEKGLEVFQYLLELLSTKITFTTLIVDRLETFLITLVECYPNGNEAYIESLILNPRIWSHSDIKTQFYILEMLGDNIKSNSIALKPEVIVDLLMNNMEMYIRLEVQKEVIEKIWGLLSDYLKTHFSIKTLNVVIGYANIHYINRLKNYPELLMYTLLLLIDCYMGIKGKMIKEMKTVIKTKKSCKLVSTMLLTIEYFMYQIAEYNEKKSTIEDNKRKSNKDPIDKIQYVKLKECDEEECDEVLMKYYGNKFEILDRIMAICFCFIINFDWSIFGDFVKDVLKEEANANKLLVAPNTTTDISYEEALLTSLIKLVGKVKGIDSIILESIFQYNKIGLILGQVSYKVLISIALNRPKEVMSTLGLKSNLNEPTKDSKIINSPSVLEFIFRQARHFNSEAMELLVRELGSLLEKQPKFLKELIESNCLIQLILGLEQFPDDTKLIKIQADLLCNMISPSQPHWSCYLSGTSIHKLNVLDKALDLTLDNYLPINDKQGLVTAFKCIDFAYELEDILELHFIKEEPNELFIKVLCKFVLLLDKSDFLYVSLPIWTVFEQREAILARKFEELSHQEREGGILRILLKAILICLKSNKDISYNIFKYVICRDKAIKKNIKDYVGRISKIKSKEGKHSKCQSVVNMIFNKNPEYTKQYETINEFYMKKVITREYCILDSKKINKVVLSKEINYFSHPHTLLLHLFTSLIQLVHFELLGIKSYTEISKDKELLTKIAEAYKRQEKKISDHCRHLIELMRGIIEEDKGNLTLKMLTTEFNTLLDLRKGKLTSGPSELRLDNAYSNLNSTRNCIEEKKFNPGEIETKLGVFTGNWNNFVTILLNTIKLDNIDKSNENLVEIFLSSECLFEIQPMILFLTLHPFNKLESYINSTSNSLMETKPIEKDLINKLDSLFGNINVPKVKLRRDIMTSYSYVFGEGLYQKMLQEQQSELGCWFNKSYEKYHKSLFDYVQKKYKKLCRNSKNKEVFEEFITLRSNRDKLGRSLIVKKFDRIEEDSYIGYSYGYIRNVILKKMIGRYLCKESLKMNAYKFYNTDFKFKFVKRIFGVQATEAEREKLLVSKVKDISEDNKKVEPDERVPKNMRPYNVELITIKGSKFGKLGIYKDSIIFHNAQRKQRDKYKCVINQLPNIKIIKEWKIENIAEIIVKRYKLVRQAIEIYFTNSNSIFIYFYDKKYLKDFTNKLGKTLTKKGGIKPELVLDPESYFAEKQFCNLWVNGVISNFNYLMMLNKYSGRTFNDLNQYPVFPWIIQDYKNDIKKLTSKELYRPLELPVASLSQGKVTCANQKYELLEQNKYQFDSHYLPSIAVFAYMIKMDPYASLLPRYKETIYDNKWMFRTLFEFWDANMNSSSDNRELIPEFFYLPEIFDNHNCRLFNTEANKSYKELLLNKVILPIWAKNKHKFIKINSTHLESKQVSFELHKWIDLIFGEKQQDPKSFNMFKPLSDEDYVSNLKITLNNSQLIELQEAGVNPIRLFSEKHPPRDEKKFSEKGQYAIFNSSKTSKKTNEPTGDAPQEFPQEKIIAYALLTIKNLEEKQAVIFLESFEKKAVAILTSQKLYQTKESYINVPHEKTMSFEKKNISLFPFKPSYDNAMNMYSLYDSQRCFISRVNGTQLITCRHYDNSWKIMDCTTGTIKESIYFHKTMVNCICTIETGDNIFTGSIDGVIAMWYKNFMRPIWHASNHNQAIISVDACDKLGVVMTASIRNTVVLRKICNGKLLRVIKLEVISQNIPYAISHVRFSYRGYLLIIQKCQDAKQFEDDYISVFSINGEQIAKRNVQISGNVIVMSENGYEFIIGGNDGKLFKYKLLSLKEHKMFDDLDGKHKGTNTVFQDFAKEVPSITAMCLTMQEGCQQLILGTNTGRFYIYKYSPRLLGYKIFGGLPGLI